jgi:enoyl reductase
VTYLRATHATGSYGLTASLTWEISWEGSDGSGASLPSGVFETTHEITVSEVQAIVR